MTIPLRNVILRMKQRKLDAQDRRKSCQGAQFGFPTRKQLINYPTVVE